MKLLRHPFHLVDPSPWPILTAMSALVTVTGAVLSFHSYSGMGYVLPGGILLLVYCLIFWWRDVIREATFEGEHTLRVQTGLRYAVLLFILSEVWFFVAFFWGFFNSSLNPAIELGNVWPPRGIETLDAWDIPFLNTLILLTSGLTVTWAHHAILEGNRKEAILGLSLTIALGLIFTSLQYHEYAEASFTIADGAYGTTFYMSTGFHGIHVLIGTIFLSVSLYRLIRSHFTQEHHVGFEAAAWYWHFVDVIWLFLFTSIYWWGGA